MIIKRIAIAFVKYYDYICIAIKQYQIPTIICFFRFRSKWLAGASDKLFTQIVLMLCEEGLVTLKVQYIDGTKIESVANKYTFVWRGGTEKNKAKLEANVRAVLEAAETVLAMENAEDQQELTAGEMSRRADRILNKMDEDDLSDRYGFQSDEICADSG